ncbi:MAG TPA: nitroreductase family protein [Candidatus Binatia bacterium]|nr:nitroreductase family protein [Candidatus Binatia bacterium]
MDVFEAIETSWAIRRFTDEPVTDDEIRRCLQAAICAPSGGNIQPWQFLVVTDAGVRAQLGAIYKKAYDRYEPALLAVRRPYKNEQDEKNFQRISVSSRHLADNLARVPAMVLFMMPSISMTLSDAEGSLDVGTPYASVYPAVQNFILAARALGLGTVLTTAYRIYQDDVRAACGIPDRYEVVALLPVGRPAMKFGRGRRRPLAEVASWNRFGERR